MKMEVERILKGMMKSFFLLCILTLVGCASTTTNSSSSKPTVVSKVPSSKNNITAVNPKAYSYAYKQFYDRAVQGDSIAQNNLGRMYSDGRGVEPNSEEAIKWFKKAATQGNTHAMVNLGMATLHGRGVVENKKQACRYFLKAGTMGDREGNQFYSSYCVV